MNCLNHPEVPAVAFCRSCGKPLCETCKRAAQGTVYCEEHMPAVQGGAPAPPQMAPGVTAPYSTVVADSSVSPGLAFVLGLLIPGVGAIYNGQYAKGLVHAIIFGLMVSVLGSGSAHGMEPLFGILLAAWVFYMAMEAYHTAKKRRAGHAADEFSSLIDLHTRGGRFPAGAVVLILVGVLLLLNTTDLIPLERILRYWPVLLIVVGVYMLYVRLTGFDPNSRDAAAVNPAKEVQHDRQ